MRSANKVQTSLRLDENSLIEAKYILSKLGMSFTEAVNIFTSMIVQNNGLPFEVKIPNNQTKKAIEEARKGINLETVTLEQLQEEAKHCLQ
ncbi:type II toxin-antitoxin system RelB/DinJ family antitoxin [Sulfuricurvum sp.]|uniref:type II toxin-antitoxin system RelB/DinJ family antitoxin n=1 Tax=Sulfuricurvum sp. TaxID=2025608 RepID=UPI001990ADEE|nr:type II toxin-antitoxin system RelB/DinJ family antitoxin [Sulfuricurvum sp.]MBD3799612.1 type II toxin-antitoxin system RelB/DinJ family antitoxin [Campylobacterota bacterium]MBD3806796.1 type II toxin-antitoxin system RelB/DinJ family antitoxin [Sulfuricurvum sp.]